MKKKPSKKSFIVEDQVFKTQVLFLCGYSHKEMEIDLKRRGVKSVDCDYFRDANGSAMFFDEEDGGPFNVVWLRNFDDSPVSIGCAAHEIFHLVIRICDRKGIPVLRENNSDETGAYLHDFYMRNLIANLTGKSHEY